MNQSDIKAETRISALEAMVTTLYNIVMMTAIRDEDEILALEKTLLDSASLATVSQFDPAMADHISDEHRAALERLLEGARTVR